MPANPLKVKGQAGAIFFDAAGTLIHLVRPVGWHYAEIARRHGLEVASDDLEKAFRQQWKALPPRPASPGRREDDDRSWWKTLAINTLRSVASPSGDFDEDEWFDELYDHFAQPGVWALYDDVEPCLTRLQGKFRLAVLSNFDGRLRKILSDLNIASAFEHLFISSEIGCDKPEARIFRHAAQAMQTEPDLCLHVGDDPMRDWDGAEKAGFQVYRLERPPGLNSLRP